MVILKGRDFARLNDIIQHYSAGAWTTSSNKHFKQLQLPPGYKQSRYKWDKLISKEIMKKGMKVGVVKNVEIKKNTSVMD